MCEQWASQGQLTSSKRSITSNYNQLFHDLDNAKGMSGCPVWARLTIGREEQLALVGINVTGNSAVAITKTLWDRINAWMNPSKKKMPP